MSRKYRHRGYQDSESHDRNGPRRPSPDRNLTTEERIQRRSLRHATAREASEVIRCHNCGRNVLGLETIARDSACPHCAAPLHCCRACVHFDTAARWQCRAEIAVAVTDKSRANDCERYSPRLVLDHTGRRNEASGTSRDPRAQFDSLFKR